MKPKPRAFTIIELLVVISIIALLIGILVPAIGKAQEQAKLNSSKSNLRQIGAAHGIYAAEWNDKQFTVILDNISSFDIGGDEESCFVAYQAAAATIAPMAIIGSRNNLVYNFGSFGYNPATDQAKFEPIRLKPAGDPEFIRFGSFRIPNYRSFSTYLNGRFYDPVFYAPMDKAVFAAVEPFFEQPDEYIPPSETGNDGIMWSSYCTSPAAMFNPDVMSNRGSTPGYYQDPYGMAAGFRSPRYGQANYPSLKTHVIEHNWNQNQRNDCSPYFGLGNGTYFGCEPYFFNHGFSSRPVTLFYDGHIGQIGCNTAFHHDWRVYQQTENKYSLWTRDTPLGGEYAGLGTFAGGGYFINAAGDWTNTSFHILTTFGIRGRDILSQ